MSGPDMPIRTIFVCGARLILCDYQFRVSIGLSGGVTKTIFETSSRIRENPNSEKEIPKAVLYTSTFDVIQGRFAIPSLTNSPLLRHTAVLAKLLKQPVSAPVRTVPLAIALQRRLRTRARLYNVKPVETVRALTKAHVRLSLSPSNGGHYERKE